MFEEVFFHRQNQQSNLYSLESFLNSDVYFRLKSIIDDLDKKAIYLYSRWGDYVYFVFDYFDYSLCYTNDLTNELREKIADLVDTFDIFFEHKQCRRTLVLCHELYLLNLLNPFFYAYLDYVSKDVFMRALQVYEFLLLSNWKDFELFVENKVAEKNKHKDKNNFYVQLDNYISTSEFKEYLSFFEKPKKISDYLVFKNRKFNFLYSKIDSLIGLSLSKNFQEYSYFDYLHHESKEGGQDFIYSIRKID